jgi:hypothetical protein
MRNAVPLMSFLLMASCAMASPTDGKSIPDDYSDAIDRAAAPPNADVRYELERCVRHWSVLNVKRATLGVSKTNRSLLIEIGNSGFPRYDYVRIDGPLMSSSLGPTVDISKVPLGAEVAQLYSVDVADLRVSADDKVDDGDCYFLTINGEGGRQTAAIYGKPSSTVLRQLMDRILNTARPPKAEKK